MNPPSDGMAASDPALALRAHVRGTLRGLGARGWPVLLVAAFCWISFSAFRVILLVLCRSQLADVSRGDVARCLGNGFLYDSVPTGYLLIPLVLMAMLPSTRWLESRWFRHVVTGYITAVVVAVVVLETIGTAFFLQFGLRLNVAALEYLGNAREIVGHIWIAYPAWAFVLAVAVLIPLLYWSVGRRLWRRPMAPVTPAVRLPVTAALVFLSLLAALGWSFYYPLDRTAAYGKGMLNTLVSEMTCNNAYTIGHAMYTRMGDGRGELTLYPFPPREEAHATTAALLYQPGESPLNSPKNPLWRRVATGRPVLPCNVVVIIMEGMTGPYVGCMGQADSATPVLDRLAEKGVFFDRCYAVGARTSRGMTGTLCGFPDIGGSSIFKQPQAMGNFLTLPALLAKRGYRTSFIYGGDPGFDNMAAFLHAGGVRQIIGQQDFIARGITGPATCWGLADEVTLDRAHEAFVAHGNERFVSVVLTVSNHEPFDVPLDGAGLKARDDFEGQKRNGVRYADYALGKFFEQARQAAYFNNTLFVLVADHGRYFDRGPVIDIEGFRIPFILYAPGLTDAQGDPLLPPRRVSTVCSQTDVAPTLLGLLGGDFDHCFMGRDILRIEPESGFALLHEDDRLAFVTSRDAVMLLPTRAPHYVLLNEHGLPMPTSTSMPTSSPTESIQLRADELTHKMLAFYRTALDLYLERAHGPQALESATTGEK